MFYDIFCLDAEQLFETQAIPENPKGKVCIKLIVVRFVKHAKTFLIMLQPKPLAYTSICTT